MPEPTPNPNPTPNPTPAPSSKFAGKYETPDALADGYKNLYKKVHGEDFNKPLTGQGGRYSDTAALEDAYRDLERVSGKMTAAPPKTEPAAPKPGDPLSIPKDPPADLPKGTAGILARAGLSGKEQELADQWTKHGKFTPEQYEGLKKAGFDEQAANEWAEGVQARAQVRANAYGSAVAEAETIAGGKEKLQALIAQAKDFVPKEDIADFDRRLADPKFVKGAVRDLMAMHQDAIGAGRAQPLVGGTPSTAGLVITTAEEFRKVSRAAANGDPDAIKRLDATPIEACQKFMNI